MVKRKHITLPLLALFIPILFACSHRAHPSSEVPVILYPSPPDTARFQFLTRYGNSEDVRGNKSRFKEFVAGDEEPLPISKPYGIGVYKNKIFIVDPGIEGLEVIDLEKKQFDYFRPLGMGKLKLPINCHFDVEGNLYIADIDREQVVIFDEQLNYSGAIGGSENFKPTDVFIYGDTVFITDPKNNRINVYDRIDHQKLFSFPENAQAGDLDWLYNPINLYVYQDRIYITDFGHSRIKIFSLDGKFLRSVGSYGRNLGQFVRPKGITVDKEMNLFVVDAGFENVQVFNKEGKLLLFFGGTYTGPGDMYLPAKVSIDYNNISYFEKYVAPEYTLKYLIFVTNQYGPDKVNVYGRIVPK